MKDISMHIMDILQNSIRAKADRVELNVTEDHAADTLTLEFIDNGTGMSEETLAKVLNPFFWIFSPNWAKGRWLRRSSACRIGTASRWATCPAPSS